MQRETLGSRLGFILISAGCAIGLGNVWRFPYITGENGGGAFILLYLLFLVVLGLPIMAMEFTVGRGSQAGIARSFDRLEPAGSKWHVYKWVALAGNCLLMMFYTVVAGWFLNYTVRMATGSLSGLTPDQVGATFGSMMASPTELVSWMLVVVFLGALVCSLGVRNGVERITKIMMIGLLVLLAVLVVVSVTLPGAGAGVAFFLLPDFSKLFSSFGTFAGVAYDAMGQSFFTLSIGIGSMAIFGSYIGREKRLFNEAITIGGLDTLVAVMAGLIIFPACFAFGTDVNSGPGLAFVTLPNIFNQMWAGQLWGTLFFLLMSFAALSTVVAVFENIIAFGMDQWDWSRKKSSLVTFAAIAVLSMPAALGMNVWADFAPVIGGSIDGLEDFIVSNNILPLGAMVYVLFCTTRKGWGWQNFLAEANTGNGLPFPKWLYGWMRYGVPALVIVIFIMGWIPTLGKIFGA